MRPLALGLLALAGALSAQTTKPAKLTVHTWVREDIFAGFMANDMERFHQGRAKLDVLLKETPDDPAALGWKGSSDFFLAVKAHEAGKKDEFEKWYASGVATMDKAAASRNGGAIATTSATYTMFADRMPEPQRTESLKKGWALFNALYQGQKAIVDQLPLHMKGELYAGLAQAAAKLDQQEDAKKWLQTIVEKMPGTVYESRAKRWLEQPELARKGSLVCITCHDEGRLKPRMAALEKAGN